MNLKLTPVYPRILFAVLIVFALVTFGPAALAQSGCPAGDNLACVTGINIAPGSIIGDGAHTAVGTITIALPNPPPQRTMVQIYSQMNGSVECIPPAHVYAGDPSGYGLLSGCEGPQGDTSISFKIAELNNGTSPFVDTVTAAVGYSNDAGMGAQLTVNPIPPPMPTGPNTPTICTHCNDTGGGAGTENSAGTAGDNTATGASAGMPVDLATGNLWISHTDYSLPGARGGLDLTRTWNSVWQMLGPVNQSGMFGNGWTSTYEQALQPVTITTTGGPVMGQKAWFSSGNAGFFTFDSSGGGAGLDHYNAYGPQTFRGDLGFDTSAQNFTFTENDGTKKVFNQPGNLTQIIDRNNNTTTISYDNQSRITQVTDPVGRWIRFNYADANNPSQTTSVYDAVGTIATYQYSQDGNHLLTRVTYADGTILQFQYNDPNSNTLISAVLDGAGKVIEQQTFDSQRRGTASGRAIVPGGSYPVNGLYINYSLDNNLMRAEVGSQGWQTSGVGGNYWFAQIGGRNRS